MARPDSLSPGQARRLALRAQGFGVARPPQVDRAALNRQLRRIHLLQIDSVSVVVRSQYLPVFSRLGSYDRGLLDRAAWSTRRQRSLFETWAHEASLLPVEYEPLLRWRKRRVLTHGEGVWRTPRRIAREKPQLLTDLVRRVERDGSLAASDLESRAGGSSWWGWTDTRAALDWLFRTGQLMVATRRPSFERVYDLPERVLPAAVLAEPTPDETTARCRLLLLAADALGIATAAELGDYFRLSPAACRPLVADLVAAGELVPVSVPGARRPCYLRPGTVVPRRVDAAALLSPFDPIVWARSRASWLFDFDYRIEIYTPAAQRVHGYYVLPFLLGDRLVARVDVKADRRARRLLVRGAHPEPGVDLDAAAGALSGELTGLATWLDLVCVDVDGEGELMAALRSAAG